MDKVKHLVLSGCKIIWSVQPTQMKHLILFLSGCLAAANSNGLVTDNKHHLRNKL